MPEGPWDRHKRMRGSLASTESFPVQWNRRRVVLHPQAPGSYGRDTGELGADSPFALVVRWLEITRLEALYPWPRFAIAWRSQGDRQEKIFTGRGGLFHQRRAIEAFGEDVERLFELAREKKPSAVRDGWTVEPVVEWEQVSGFPPTEEEAAAEEAVALGGGAYRTGRRTVEELALAARAAPTSLEALLYWLASTPDRPWREHPKEVRVSAEYLYAELRGRGVHRLPLDALRHRAGLSSEDALYTFGKKTSFILPYRPSCRVRAALDHQLFHKNNEMDAVDP